MPSEFTRMAVENMRHVNDFHWSFITLLIITAYFYAEEADRKNWNGILAGLAFWGVDWFNEIANSLIYQYFGAPLWGVHHPSSFQIMIGLNIEITMMFAIVGLMSTKLLLADKHQKILGLPNRWFVGIASSVVFVLVEHVLNAYDILTWDWWFWNRGLASILIVIFGYLTFFMTGFWVYDMIKMRSKIIAVASILGFDAVCLVVFGLAGWL
jgi:hypothetical protein